MSPITERLASLGPQALEGALLALDDISRPLTAREIERALRNHGVPRSRAVVMAASICKLHIIALVGSERG